MNTLPEHPGNVAVSFPLLNHAKEEPVTDHQQCVAFAPQSVFATRQSPPCFNPGCRQQAHPRVAVWGK